MQENKSAEYWERVSDAIEALHALQEAGGGYPLLRPLLKALEADLDAEAQRVRFRFVQADGAEVFGVGGSV
jgi:hypothetical protein